MENITLDAILAAKSSIAPFIIETPTVKNGSAEISRLAGPGTDIFLKLELLQHAGSFKPRGALSVMMNIEQHRLKAGVTAVSAGNHAIAVGYAAKILGTTAKVVMMKNANPFRIRKCQALGAEVILEDNVHAAFERVKHIEETEGRTFVHPFEGYYTALGTATVGYELCQQAPNLDAVIVPIGGGGLCGGVAAAVKLMQPKCRVYGVEPTGADSMHRSRASGKPESIEKVQTIADSLGAPHAAPFSFSLCQKYVDELVLVDDARLIETMKLLFREAKLAVEPAGAAALAALLGPLHKALQGKRVGLIVCGANIDESTWFKLCTPPQDA